MVTRARVVGGALGLVLGLAAAPPQTEACTSDGSEAAIAANTPDVFAWFDQAAVVAEVEVVAAPGFSNEGHGLPGDVVLAVRRALKGRPGKRLTLAQPMTACGGQARGAREVLFLDGKGELVGYAPLALEDAVVRWAAAVTDPDREATLTALAATKELRVVAAVTTHRRVAAAKAAAKATEAAAAAAKAAPAAWSLPMKGWKAPGTAPAAIAQVRDRWSTLRAAAPTALAAFDGALAHGQCQLTAARQPCLDLLKLVKDVATDLTLGSPGTLDHGACWSVSCGVGFKTMRIFLDAADGHVAAVWLPPEG